MQVITIKDWADFERQLTHKHYRKWIFRGQSSFDWLLESSLSRAFAEANNIRSSYSSPRSGMAINKREHEKVMIDRFRSNAHLYLQHLPPGDDELSWLSIMQHHGAPTRLLDFSFSPYIALYFALESGDGDAALYCINHNALAEADEEYFGKGKAIVHSRVMDGEEHKDDPCLYAFEPHFSNQRLLSQQGLFVAVNNLNYTHEESLTEYNYKDSDLVKFKIPARLRYSGIRLLHRMNITATNIYPGLDGFCQSLKKQPVFGLEGQKRIG
ncbi:FRG domain-containing protein [Pseudoalteromonas luteoviolacea]|uniref:FRG domain-containing protein n=1 Tax=Pseudoalteromonas luteoviolacea TaxID=43657 RepID=UPI001B3799E5|nr:FRG domain-containing protein [Pseudoalteromonas luteoviolacea]MBQ4811107.1 FRG domain-containing protein [Pseudoalteromonas luteoviolacea]